MHRVYSTRHVTEKESQRLWARRPSPLPALLLALTALFAAVAPVGAAGAGGWPAWGKREVAAPAFGVAAHFLWHDLGQTTGEVARLQAAGFRTVRFDVGWRWVEPERKGRYDAAVLAKLDAILAQLAMAGIAPIVTVIETPAWARPAGTAIFTPPTDPQDYADLLGMLAARYVGAQSLTWEIWNEPNLIEFWATGPNPVQYTALLRRAYTAIKAVAPGATVLAGSIAFNDRPYLEGMYAAGAAGAFDGLAIHPYTAGRAPGDDREVWFSLRAQLSDMQAILAAHGEGWKGLYLTEFGWSLDDVDEATRADYMRQAVALLRQYPQVRVACAYTIAQGDNPAYGLIATSGAETPTWRAFAAAAR